MNIANLVPELICSDIEASLAFYTKLLHFTILYSRPEERFFYLEHNGAQLMLEQTLNRSFLADALIYPYGRGINLQIKTENVIVLYAELQEVNATIYLPLEKKEYRCNDQHFINQQFIVQDPDGYLLRFSETIETR
jgi:lactoylglutathione lyase